MRGRWKKRVLCLVFAAALLLSGSAQGGMVLDRRGGVLAERAAMETTRLESNVTGGARNWFSYAGEEWVISERDREAYIDLGTFNAQAENYYYEVHFYGNGINIYASKAPEHGKVRFSVDGKREETVDLYQRNREMQRVYSARDLEEGEHVLKAVTLNEKSGGKIVNQVNYAEIVHEPYRPEDMRLEAESYLLEAGTERQIVYQTIPADASFTDLVYSSSDDTVASVSAEGLIAAKKAGTAEITLSSVLAGITKTIAVTVTERLPAFGGAVVDADTQYTQDRFDEVTQKGEKTENLTAWKNDHALSVLALYARGEDVNRVSVKASDFTKENGDKIPAENVKTYFIKSTTAYNGGYVGGSYPAATKENRSEAADILSRDSVVDIKDGKLQPVWVDITVPKDAPAGDYAGTLTASDENGSEISFPYTLHVQEASLKDASEFKGVFDIELWQYPYSSAEYYDVEPFSEEHFKILESSMRKYKEIGGYAVTTTIVEEAWSMKAYGIFAGQTYSKNEVHYPSMVKWTKNADGTFSYDYTDFDKWVAFNKSLGIGDKILLYSVAPWHNSFSYWEDGTLKYEEFMVGSDRYKEVWRDFLTDLIGHLEEKGWFEDAYIGIDERGFSNGAFDLIESVKGSGGKPLKTAGAMDSIDDPMKEELALRVTDLNVGSTAAAGKLAFFKEALAKRQSEGLRTTIYSCTGHQPGNFSLCAPVENYWTIINAAKMGTAGFLRWAYDAWVEDPLRDTTHQWFEPGDCFLIYPSEKDAEEKAAQSSVRLEKMAQGVRDVNKLMQIKEELPDFTEKAAAVYDRVTTTALSSRQFLDAERRKALSAEMGDFRKGLEELTEEYAAERIRLFAHSVKIEKGTAEKEKYMPEETVKIKADAPEEGMEFKVWKVIKGGVSLKDASGAETEFVMPEEDVELKAEYEKKETDNNPKPPGPEDTPGGNPAPGPGNTPGGDPAPAPGDHFETGTKTESGNEIIKKKLPLLLAKAKGENKQIRLSWTKAKGADGYEVYWSYRSGKEDFHLVSETGAKTAKTIHKGLNHKKQYMYFIAAFKRSGQGKMYTAVSEKLYVSQKSEKTTNVKSIRLNKGRAALKKGKTFQIKAKLTKENPKKKLLKKAAECRYHTSDAKVASVDKKGKVKAKKKGKCVVYVIANNGVSAQLRVTVR